MTFLRVSGDLFCVWSHGNGVTESLLKAVFALYRPLSTWMSGYFPPHMDNRGALPPCADGVLLLSVHNMLLAQLPMSHVQERSGE